MKLLTRPYGRLDALFGWLHPLGKLLVGKTGMAQVVAKVSKYHQTPQLEAGFEVYSESVLTTDTAGTRSRTLAPGLLLSEPRVERLRSSEGGENPDAMVSEVSCLFPAVATCGYHEVQ